MKAFALWAEGYNDPVKLRQFRNSPTYIILAGKWKVRQRDVASYFTKDFWHNLSIWQHYKSMGLPYSGGWAEQPAQLIKLYSLFDIAESLVRNHQAKANK